MVQWSLYFTPAAFTFFVDFRADVAVRGGQTPHSRLRSWKGIDVSDFRARVSQSLLATTASLWSASCRKDTANGSAHSYISIRRIDIASLVRLFLCFKAATVK